MKSLLQEVRACTICATYLSAGVNPILAAASSSRIAIIGQAPGSIVHHSGIPWDDQSGDRLRSWLGVDNASFYNPGNFAIIPMGFCYPGKGRAGDLPPRKECAPQWHGKLFQQMKHLKLILLIGAYAQEYYLGEQRKDTLTETVRNYKLYLPKYLVLPHPSPRNNIWIKKNPWFEQELLPKMKSIIEDIGLLSNQ
jgi:uracil-DNA glycosylase